VQGSFEEDKDNPKKIRTAQSGKKHAKSFVGMKKYEEITQPNGNAFLYISTKTTELQKLQSWIKLA
jgi:hypothetical protein